MERTALEVVQAIREMVADEGRWARYEHYCVDLLLEAAPEGPELIDPAFFELSDEERNEYLRDQSHRMVRPLLIFVIGYVVTHLELVEEWRSRRKAGLS